MPFVAQEFFVRFVRALGEADIATLAAMVHPEFVGDFPQSGERIIGFEGFRAQLEQYPGGAPPPEEPPDARVVGDDERWGIAPNYTVVPLRAPNVFTILQRAHYPDGSKWHVITIAELRDDLVYRADNYFAPDMEPPEWRRGMAEPLPRA